MIIVIDNYDSFTYNLVQAFGTLGAELCVFRNDQTTLDEIAALAPTHIVISPGPGDPDDGGVSLDVIRTLGPHIPILGVCLGHQCIGQAYGGQVVRAPRVMHGKTSMVYHQGDPLFTGIPSPFEATRYHSLIVGAARTGFESNCIYRPGRSDGFAAHLPSGRRRAVPPGEHPDELRATPVTEFFGGAVMTLKAPGFFVLESTP
jgi:anthranilate synthase/aminodeoxychorismate synthase-like glutamine amidotransferase